MDPELYLAYDGSINADWMARYALCMSTNTPSRQLTLLHIRDGTIEEEIIASKLERLLLDSQELNVELKIVYLRLEKSVIATLLEAIPWGQHNYCICGARATSQRKRFLGGTTYQELLRAKKFNTLALRVVNPGLLGCPVNVMFPLSGRSQNFAAATPFLLMLLPYIKKLTLLRVMMYNPILFRYLSVTQTKKGLQQGMTYLQEAMAEIDKISGNGSFVMDDYVLISDNWAREILVQAGKSHVGLMLLDANDRPLQSRFYGGNKIEQILRRTPCDVGVYQKI